MSDQRIFKLVGAIRVVPDIDCVGVPVFQLKADEHIFICETDERLEIAAFESLNKDDWNVEMPDNGLGESYRVGDTAPLPFWLTGSLMVLPCDVSLRRIDQLANGQAQFFPVLNRIKATVEAGARARDGGLDPEKQRELEKRIADFLQDPMRPDKDWVSAFVGLLQKTKTAGAARSHPMWGELKALGESWIARHASKCSWRTVLALVQGIQEAGSAEMRTSAALAIALISILTRVRDPSEQVRRAVEHFQRSVPGRSIVECLRTDPAIEPKIAERTLKSFEDALRRAVARADGWRVLNACLLTTGGKCLSEYTEAVIDRFTDIRVQEIVSQLSIYHTLEHSSQIDRAVRQGLALRIVNDIRVLAGQIGILNGQRPDTRQAASCVKLSQSELDELVTSTKMLGVGYGSIDDYSDEAFE